MIEWRPVAGYEGLYEVSNTGIIRSLFRYKKELKPQISNSGYETVELFKNKTGKRTLVHRVVAQAFCDRPEGCDEVNHLDEVKLNNHADNLEWTTRKGNVNYGTGIARRVANTNYANRVIDQTNHIVATSKPIFQYDKSGKFIRTWKSASECHRETGIAISGIRRCARGERKTAGGYIFKEGSEMAYC